MEFVFQDWVNSNISCRESCSNDNNLQWNLSFAVTVWFIWGERNNWVFNKRRCDVNVIVSLIVKHVREIIRSRDALARVKVGKVEAFIGWEFPKDDSV